MKTLLVEGWRFIPHSYAMVNHYHLLEILRRPDITVYHRDVPYISPTWKPVPGLLPPEDEAKLRAIPAEPPGLKADAMLRIGYPHQLGPDPASDRRFVWATSEFKRVEDAAVGGRPAAEVLPHMACTVIASSNWARAGFVNSGAPPEKVVVVNCGVDASLFKPAAPEQRAALRKSLGWEGKFVVLNVSAMTGNKGIPILLKGVAALAQAHPNVHLVLKGTDGLYGSEQYARSAFGALTPEEAGRVQARLGYLGQSLSTPKLISLYQAADAYVSPYHAEGFNLPVLEAAACGLPVICTSGGSTDDFTSPDWCLGIRSEERLQPSGKRLLLPDLGHFNQQMLRMATDDTYRAGAREAGPAWVQSRFTWKHSVDHLLSVICPS
jgi:glycosyltransferase involved in cell wall biosynthesis